MHSSDHSSATSGPINFLKHYCFETHGQSYERVLDSWLERFPLSWVNLALVESLHQGRYKVISVEQILTLWQRRGKPSYHFNHDFERLVSNKLPQAFDHGEARVSKRNYGLPSSSRRRRSFPLETRETVTASEFTVDLPSPTPPQDHDQVTIPEQVPDTNPVWAPQNHGFPYDGNKSSLDPTPQEKTAEPVQTSDAIIEAEAEPDTITSAQHDDTTELGQVSEQSDDHEDIELQMSVPSSNGGKTFHPIHQFVPQSVTSVFHEKLTAMAQINV